jgi:hypothetical protein
MMMSMITSCAPFTPACTSLAKLRVQDPPVDCTATVACNDRLLDAVSLDLDLGCNYGRVYRQWDLRGEGGGRTLQTRVRHR